MSAEAWCIPRVRLVTHDYACRAVLCNVHIQDEHIGFQVSAGYWLVAQGGG